MSSEYGIQKSRLLTLHNQGSARYSPDPVVVGDTWYTQLIIENPTTEGTKQILHTP